MYHIYTTTLPPHIHLCEQDSMLQKFIKIYNLPRTASILLIPRLELRLLYLCIKYKYTSPVKLLCWEHSGDFCPEGKASEGRERLCIARSALGRAAWHKDCGLQCPRAPCNAGTTAERAPRCPSPPLHWRGAASWEYFRNIVFQQNASLATGSAPCERRFAAAQRSLSE